MVRHDEHGRALRAQGEPVPHLDDGGRRPGPTGVGGFKAEPARYHLYVSLACPWAHRTLIFRAIKGLSDMIAVSVTHWRMLENGWTFAEGPDVVPDALYNSRFLYEVYLKAEPTYSGRVIVPILWDKATGTIVNNESAEIIRMFNSAFDGVGARPGDYYPADLRDEIDALNTRIYDTVNNGVYKASPLRRTPTRKRSRRSSQCSTGSTSA